MLLNMGHPIHNEKVGKGSCEDIIRPSAGLYLTLIDILCQCLQLTKQLKRTSETDFEPHMVQSLLGPIIASSIP